MRTRVGPKVSVLLPVFNGERFLAEAVESVLHQSYENFELIVSDDCSTDGSYELLSRYAASDKRLKLSRNETRSGLFANYNACIERASSSLIKFFAQDDVLDGRMLEAVVEAFSAHPDVALVSTARTLIDAGGRSLSPAHDWNRSPAELFGAQKSIAGSEVIRYCAVNVENVIGEPSAVAVRKSCIEGGFDQKYYHLGDLEYWLRVLMNGNYFYHPEPLCRFRHHALSRSAVNESNALFIPDVSRFAKSFAALLDGDQQGKFYSEALQRLAPHTSALLSNGRLDRELLGSKEALASATVGGHCLPSGPALDRLLGDLIEFRDVAIVALDMVARSKNDGMLSYSGVDRNELRIQSLERALNLLLHSHSWKSTKVLRDLRCWIKKPNKRSGELLGQLASARLKSAAEDPVTVQERQRTYIKYLRWTIRCIKGSLSWRITAPLRAPGPLSLDAPPSRLVTAHDRMMSRSLAPAMPAARHRYYLSVGTMFRDDARFLKEWLEFHLLLGVEHFFLYNNRSADDFQAILKPYVSQGIVELIDWPFESDGTIDSWRSIERFAFNDMLERARGVTTWLAMTAVDEFLYPVNEDRLPDFLRKYENHAGLCVNWHAFGTAGVKRIPQDQLMIETLTRSAAHDHPYNLHYKSIVRPECVCFCANAHEMSYYPGYYPVNPDHRPVEGKLSPYVSSDKIRINHYWTGDEFMLETVKIPRSRRAAADRWSNESELMAERVRDFNACPSDSSILRFVPRLRQRMGWGKSACSVPAGQVLSSR